MAEASAPVSKEQEPPRCYAFSADTAKIVHLVRHGQGKHNVEAALRGSAAYKNESLKDAPLDATGKAQATALGQRIREARMQVDIVLVSPLTRALETAVCMFPADSAPSAPAPVPIVAVEWCREAHGGHPCDQRSRISEISTKFPLVNFSGIETDDDKWHHKDKRETVREVAIRCDRFLEILKSRPERNIVVVSHGVFLETLLNRATLYCADDPLRLKRFENAEMRSIVIGGWTSPLAH